MPLIAYTDLPTFQRLRDEGAEILTVNRADNQDIREIHIGVLNIMPDLEATERQFCKLIGSCNQITQFHVHFFTIDGIERNAEAKAHINKYYEPFEKIQRDGLDALIISGANVTNSLLDEDDFWNPLIDVFSWAQENVTSILCSCLAAHAIVQHLYGIKRSPLKQWGVFSHTLVDRTHPLVASSNTRFDVPHSRFYDISRNDMERVGIKVLVSSQDAGVHLAVSPDGFRVVFFQGHPEYDDISLLKEYKREVMRFYYGETNNYPSFPENYFNDEVKLIFTNYELKVRSAKFDAHDLEDFPEVNEHIYNTWGDTSKAIFNNWIGKVYQLTHHDRHLPFMEGIDPLNPLNL